MRINDLFLFLFALRKRFIIAWDKRVVISLTLHQSSQHIM